MTPMSFKQYNRITESVDIGSVSYSQANCQQKNAVQRTQKTKKNHSS